MPSPWLTRREAADYLRIAVDTLDAWARSGKVTRYKVNGLQSVRFHRDELDALVKPAAEDRSAS